MRLTTFVLTLAALSGAACFRPEITDGGFRCAAGDTPCPDGFGCEPATGLCKRHPSPLVGGKGGAGGGAGGIGGAAGASGAGGAGGALPCFTPRASCDPDPDAGVCDPFCQTGCAGCREKCSVSTAGDVACNPPTKTKLAGPLEACGISNPGTPLQSDDCAPGSVCIDANVCFSRCFVFCRSDADCPGAFCDRDVGGGQRVCGVPTVDACVPLMVGSNTGCAPSQACYLSASHPEHTFCDCPQGAGRVTDDCAHSVDCGPGLACTWIPTVGKPTCRQVCDLNKAGADCGVPGQMCRAYPGASAYSTDSNARWGFCI